MRSNRRKKLTAKKSKRIFRNGANRVHRKNVDSGASYAMRGGIRL